jgi:hypothetical protein
LTPVGGALATTAYVPGSVLGAVVVRIGLGKGVKVGAAVLVGNDPAQAHNIKRTRHITAAIVAFILTG